VVISAVSALLGLMTPIDSEYGWLIGEVSVAP
jgi:hypothetical protein